MNPFQFSRTIIGICLLAIPAFIRAGNPVDPDFKRNIISFNLATPFDPSFPRLRTGYTFVASPYFSQTFEIGYGSRMMFPDSAFYTHNSLKSDYRLWELRTESRYYFSGIRRYVIPYAAVEIYYIRHRQTMFNNSFSPEKSDNVTIDYVEADFLRTKSGFNMKFGMIFRMGPVMAFELYGGFGPRIRNNRYTNVKNPVIDPDNDWFDDWFEDWNYYYYEGIKWNFNLTAGARISFMF